MWPFRKRPRSLLDEWEQEDDRRRKTIDRVVARQDVRNLLGALNFAVQDIEEFHDRLKCIGLSDHQIEKALRDVEILRWYFSILPSDKTITSHDFMELTKWLVKKGIV